MGIAQERRLSECPARRARPDTGLSESYPAVPSAVPAARHAVVQFAAAAGANGHQLEAIALAISEAVTNAVQYAYPASTGRIEVNAWLAGGELWMIVADDGCGLEAGSKGGGLGQGLALISQMADGLSIHHRSSGGTGVCAHFALTGARA